MDYCVEITEQAFNAITGQYPTRDIKVKVERSEHALKTYTALPDGSRVLEVVCFLTMVPQYYIQDINA